jgi:hypothetical protein
MPEGESVPDQCTDCQQPMEIAAVSFQFLRPCLALFVCISCGRTYSEEPKNKHNRSRPLLRLQPANRTGEIEPAE